jgi:dTDP-4-dehydrorhamnose reductase
MKILVTGANGLLGQKLCQLLDQDISVQLIATAKKGLVVTLNRGKFRKMDVTNKNEVAEVIAAEKPEVVIHTAAMTQVDLCESEKEACWRANVTAVEYLVDACERNENHLIHISTDFIFDGTQGPLDETAIPNPISYYGESKLAAELVVQKMKTPWAILRTVLVYGITKDMSRSNIVLWVKKSLEDGKTIHVVNDQWRTPTLAEDLALGCYLAAKKKATGVFHVSGDEMMTPFDIALSTAEYFQLDTSLVKVANSSTFSQPARRPPRTGFIIDKARKELNYQPHSFKEGLAVLASQLH